MDKFSDLADEEKEFYYDKAKEFLSGKDLLYCTRVWSAWSHKTMTEDDFYNAEDDDGLIEELAESIYNVVKVKVRKNKIQNILDNE